MNTFSRCPSCNSAHLNQEITTRDYFLTHETFSLLSCSECHLWFTNPQPESLELSRYYISEKYISHKSRPKSLFDIIYILARNYALKQKLKIINKFDLNHTVFDYGCGNGDFLNYCSKHGWNIDGFEPSTTARENAEKKVHQQIYNTQNQLINLEPYSIVTLWHVLEHIPNIGETITLLKNLIAENGKLIIALPNHESLDATYYHQYWAAYDVPRHLFHFSKKSMKYFLTKHGLRIDEIIPLYLDAYYISLLSEKYKQKKPNYLNSFLTGYKSNIYGKKTGNYSSLIYIVSKC